MSWVAWVELGQRLSSSTKWSDPMIHPRLYTTVSYHNESFGVIVDNNEFVSGRRSNR